MNTKIAQIPLRQVKDVRSLLVNDMAKQQLNAVATSHLKPERMMRLVANAARTTPKLLECEPLSLLGALMTCASLGLEPNTIMGHAYLIPFKNNKKRTTEVQIVIGYKGLIDLARRSGHITSISANIHYEDDELWEYEEGTDAKLRHRPGNLEGKKLHAYAIAKFTDGGHAYVVLPWAHVMKVRDQSQNWQSAVRYGSTDRNPWSTHEDEMAKKTAIRALAKYLPLSTEFRDAFEADEAKADYRAFAMDHTGSLEIEVSSPNKIDEAEQADVKAEPDEKPKDADNRSQKDSSAQKKAEIDEEEQFNQGLVGRIKSDINECTDADGIHAVFELFDDQIRGLPENLAHDLEKYADQKNEEFKYG